MDRTQKAITLSAVSGAKAQGWTEVTEVLVDFVSLVAAGKKPAEDSFEWCDTHIYSHINVYRVCHIKTEHHISSSPR